MNILLATVAGATVWLCSWQPALGTDRGPISVTRLEKNQPTRVDGVHAAGIAANVLGLPRLSNAEPAMVRYWDRAALGLPSRGTGWLLKTTLDLETRDDVDINVIVDGETGGLVAAYTDSTGEWPEPKSDKYDLAEMTSQAGWQLESLSPGSMTPNVVSLVETLIHQNGTDPTDPGQVIIRPRWNSPRFPARKVGDTLVPVQGRSKYWTVQVCGRKLLAPEPPSPDGKGSGFYFTERFYELRDSSLEFSGGFLMP